MPPRSRGRTGRPYLRLRARVRREEPLCWLCGEVIDPAAVWPDPGSWSLDHVVPLALGGAELDRGNARAAHLGCNGARGKRAPQRVEQLPTSRSW